MDALDTAPPEPASSARPRPAGRLTPRKPAAPRLVPLGRFPGTAPVTSTELWIGVHVSECPGQEPVRQGLERLAIRAQRFTPRVSLVPPDGLVLEVKGSLHLFNGVEGLSGALANECASLGLKPMMALAPTPLAPWWPHVRVSRSSSRS
jgi:hypothetical protein